MLGRPLIQRVPDEYRGSACAAAKKGRKQNDRLESERERQVAVPFQRKTTAKLISPVDVGRRQPCPGTRYRKEKREERGQSRSSVREAEENRDHKPHTWPCKRASLSSSSSSSSSPDLLCPFVSPSLMRRSSVAAVAADVAVRRSTV